jgi:predicted HTH domain antitoxin
LPKDVLKYVEEQARRENVDRSVMIRRFMEKGIEEFRKEKAAALYVEGKTSISGAAEIARLTIPEMVQFLVDKGYRSKYSLEDFRKGVKLLEKIVKAE